MRGNYDFEYAAKQKQLKSVVGMINRGELAAQKVNKRIYKIRSKHRRRLLVIMVYIVYLVISLHIDK